MDGALPDSTSPAAEAPAGRPRFRRLRRQLNAVEQVVSLIENEIVAGRLPVGSRLPPERDFAARLGVSRSVFREAVRTLIARGLLETRHGVGTRVRRMSREAILKPLTLYLQTNGRTVNIEQLHQVRSILEVGIAGLAAEWATPEDIQELRRLVSAMDETATQPARFAQFDTEFHRRLAQATQNPLLVLLLDSIRDLMSEIRARVARQPGLYDRVMPSHRAVFECVVRRDSAGARQAMQEHVDVALTIQRELLASQSELESATSQTEQRQAP